MQEIPEENYISPEPEPEQEPPRYRLQLRNGDVFPVDSALEALLPDAGEITTGDVNGILDGEIKSIQSGSARSFAGAGINFCAHWREWPDSVKEGIFLIDGREDALHFCRELDIGRMGAEESAKFNEDEAIRARGDLQRAMRKSREISGVVDDTHDFYQRREVVMDRRAAVFRILAILGTAVSAISISPEEPPAPAKRPFRKSMPSESTPTAAVESKEVPAPFTPFEKVLEASILRFSAKNLTYSDNILDGEETSKHFFGDRFLYTGEYPGEYGGHKQRVHFFKLIGEKSGFVGRNPKNKNRYKTTTLADAVNLLLDTEHLSPDQIKEWIKWMYKESFNIELEIQFIDLEWKEDGSLKTVFYNGKIRPIGVVSVVKTIDGMPVQPGGNFTSAKEVQYCIDNKHRLLLLSGISLYDICVPTELMRTNPKFTLSFKGIKEPFELFASDLEERMDTLEESKTRPYDGSYTSHEGGVRQIRLISRLFKEYDELVGQKFINDKFIKNLAEAILKNVNPDDHAARIKKIVAFVQSVKYRPENAENMDRPGLLTLFNEGGDCNNLVVLFAQLMLASGYKTAVLYTDEAGKKPDGKIHVLAGVSAYYFPNKQKWTVGESGEYWVPVELTDSWGIGEREINQRKECLFHIDKINRPA